MFEDNKANPTILWYWYEIKNGIKIVYDREIGTFKLNYSHRTTETLIFPLK